MKNGFMLLFLLFLFFGLIIFSDDAIVSIGYVLDTFKTSVFPSLFPFFVISSLLINYGLAEALASLLSSFMAKVFKVNPNCSFIFVMSILSGFPSSAKFTSSMLDSGLIDQKDANKIILFSHFSNPVFILTTLSLSFLGDLKSGYIILSAHYVGNIIVGLLFRNYNISKNSICSINKRIPLKFGSCLSSSIRSSLDTILVILGTTTTFVVFTTIVNKIIPFSANTLGVLNGLFEITQGLRCVSLLDISLNAKVVISCFLLSFGSFSVHAQVTSMVKINYFYYLCARILHGFISAIIAYFLIQGIS